MIGCAANARRQRDRAEGTKRLRINLLFWRTDWQLWSPDAGKAIWINQSRWRADVAESPHNEVCTDYQMVRDFALYAYVYMNRRGARQIRSVHGPLLVHFDVGE